MSPHCRRESDRRPTPKIVDPALRRQVLNFLEHLAQRHGTDVPWTTGHALDADARENA